MLKSNNKDLFVFIQFVYGKMNTVVINNFSRDPNYHLPLPEYHCHVSAIKPGDQFEMVVNISHDQVGKKKQRYRLSQTSSSLIAFKLQSPLGICRDLLSICPRRSLAIRFTSTATK